MLTCSVLLYIMLHVESVAGFVGSAFGVAMAAPLVWPISKRPLEARLLGGLLMGLSFGCAAISAKLAGGWISAIVAEHVINVVGLLTCPLLVAVAHPNGSVGRWPRRAGLLWLPLGMYLATCTVLGAERTVPFLVLLPIIIGYTALAFGLWLRSAPEPAADRLVPVGLVLAGAAVMNAAQLTRYLFRFTPTAHGLIPVVITVGVGTLGMVFSERIARSWPARRRPAAGSGATIASEALLARLHAVLDERRLFVDPTLTLAKLAAALEATPHQLSGAINAAGSTYHELIGDYRVREARRQLQDGDSERFTIEGIGLSAGFASRSAFYEAFRRREGVSPSAFRGRSRSAAGCRTGSE